ncbi:MAG: hypothetical protein KDK78_03370, partial [Chlamydiia bacterium]|nr:hypothetical protein [Chlamydiia bacterium]
MEGLEWSLSSPIGKLLWFLVAVFGALCSVYALLHWRMRSKDVLAAKYRDHYRNAEALAVGWSFVGAPRADFFGRQSIIENEQGVHAYCTLPSPDILQPDVLQRFEDFQWALHHQRLPGLRGCRWLRRGAAAASVQQGVLDAKGRCLPTLREILMEGSLRAVEAENLLLELSRALAALHDLKAPSGRLAFHGFLLPRSIYVQRGPGGEVRSVQLADTGWVFSLGAENVRSRLALLKRGKLLIDHYLGRTLLEQLPFLAPELQPQSEGELVGPEADFYSFGALAVALFTKERFVGPNTIEWE